MDGALGLEVIVVCLDQIFFWISCLHHGLDRRLDRFSWRFGRSGAWDVALRAVVSEYLSPSLVSSKSCVRKRESVERRVCIPRPRRQCALKVKDARRDLRFRPWKIQVAILNFARLGVVAELRNRDKIACGFMGDEG